MLTILNHAGRHFNVRIVRKGDSYGREDCLIHDGADPLVEFYDAMWANRNGFGPRGQFVSRYPLSTLEARAGGIALDGGEPAWTISAANRAEAVAYALSRLDTTNNGPQWPEE